MTLESPTPAPAPASPPPENAEAPVAIDIVATVSDSPLEWRSLPAMRYPDGYVWFLFFSSLDIMLTWAILERQGTEMNPVAALVILHWGLPGAIAFKFALILFVIVICEVVGRTRHGVGRNLIWFGVVVSAMPVMYSLGLLVLHTMAVTAQ